MIPHNFNQAKMKKQYHYQQKIAPSILAILLFFTLALCLVACNQSQSETSHATPHYQIELAIDTQQDTLTCKQTTVWQVPRDAKIDRLVFHVYANAFGEIDVLSCKIDDLNADFDIYGMDNTLLSIPCATNGNTVTVAFEYVVTLASGDSRLCKTSNGNYNLSHFYPVLSVFENGKFCENSFSQIGDPFYSEISSFTVDVTYPKQYALASSGVQVERGVSGSFAKSKIEAIGVRDFGLSIGKYQTQTASVLLENKSVEISYFYTNDQNVSRSLERAKDSLIAFSNAFGEYPYTTLTIVENTLSAGGMEYGGYILVAPNDDKYTYADVITHEIAHQWWYNVVGNNQIVNAWLDEGLTEWCTSYFYHLQGDKDTHKKAQTDVERSYRQFDKFRNNVGFNAKMSRPLTSYLTNGEYVAVVYLKGSILFETLRNIAGDDKMLASLKTYYQSNYMRIATKEDLIDAFTKNNVYVQGIVDSFVNDTLTFCS